MKYILIGLIKIYQMCLSPFLGNNCRFTITCSNYAIQAVQKNGAIKGTWLAAKRIIRCNPWCNCKEEEEISGNKDQQWISGR